MIVAAFSLSPAFQRTQALKAVCNVQPPSPRLIETMFLSLRRAQGSDTQRRDTYGSTYFFVSPLCISTLPPRVTGLFRAWGRGFRRSRLLSSLPTSKGALSSINRDSSCHTQASLSSFLHHSLPTTSALSQPWRPLEGASFDFRYRRVNHSIPPGGKWESLRPSHCLQEIFLCMCITLADWLIHP